MSPNPIAHSFWYYKKYYNHFKNFNQNTPQILFGIVLLLLRVVKQLKVYRTFKKQVIKKNDFLNTTSSVAIIFTANQWIVAQKLLEIGCNFDIVSFQKSQDKQHPKYIYISPKMLILLFLSNPKMSIFLMRNVEKDKIIKKNLFRYIKGIALYYLYKELMVTSYSKYVHFNDHSSHLILLSNICRQERKTSIYVQHAPVGENFPELFNDINILFSQDSVDKYKNTNRFKTLVFYDLRFPLRSGKKMGMTNEKSILVCTNLLDDKNIVEGFIASLPSFYRVILRPHPRDRRKWKLNSANVKLSSNSSIWKDLDISKYVVVSESAVVLEAIYNGNLVYKANFFTNKVHDIYGFIKKGLITTEFSESGNLLSAIKSQSITYNLAKLNYFIGQYSEENTEAVLNYVN